jgi:hypothetical protein
MNIKLKNVTIENVTICNDSDDKFSLLNENNSIRIEGESENLKKIKEKLQKPDELDVITNKFGIPSKLMNFHLAVPVNMSDYNINGLNNTIYIPVSISKENGGRSSIYNIKKGESTLVGVYINNSGILMKTVEKLSGTTEFAKVGDSYKSSLTNLKGKLFYSGIGKLKEFDKEKGEGKIHYKQTDEEQVASKVKIVIDYSHLWSMYHGRIEIEF